MTESNIDADAVDRYAEAMYRWQLARKAWDEAGQPLVQLGGATGQVEVAHRLWIMLKEQEQHCDRLEKSLKPARSQRGRPVGSASSPDRAGEPPRVTLRAVGGP